MIKTTHQAIMDYFPHGPECLIFTEAQSFLVMFEDLKETLGSAHPPNTGVINSLKNGKNRSEHFQQAFSGYSKTVEVKRSFNCM